MRWVWVALLLAAATGLRRQTETARLKEWRARQLQALGRDAVVLAAD